MHTFSLHRLQGRSVVLSSAIEPTRQLRGEHAAYHRGPNSCITPQIHTRIPAPGIGYRSGAPFQARAWHQWQLCAAEHTDPANADMQLEEVKGQVLERRAAMDAAVAVEDYQRAAQERNTLDSLLLRCRRLELAQGEATRKVKYKLGQLITHKRYEYRGVIFGMDPSCQADESWIRAMGIHRLQAGAQQPFYHVMVDERDRPGGQTTYVAQENISLTEGEKAMEISHPQIKYAFQAFEGDSYVARPPLQEKYRQSLLASDYGVPEDIG